MGASDRKDLRSEFRWDLRGHLQLRRGVLAHDDLVTDAPLFRLFVVLLAQADFRGGKGVVSVNVSAYARRLGSSRNAVKRHLERLTALGYAVPLGSRRYWLPKYDGGKKSPGPPETR